MPRHVGLNILTHALFAARRRSSSRVAIGPPLRSASSRYVAVWPSLGTDRAGFTWVKPESPWGRHFLRVCQKRIVRRCKRKKFQGFENSGRFYGRKSTSLVSLYPAALSRSFIMTYGRCEGSKSFGPYAVSFRATRASPLLKRSEQSRCPKQDPRACPS